MELGYPVRELGLVAGEVGQPKYGEMGVVVMRNDTAGISRERLTQKSLSGERFTR